MFENRSNQKFVIENFLRYKQIRMLNTAAFFISILFFGLYFIETIDGHKYTLPIAIIFLNLFLLTIFLNFNYVNFTIENQKIIIRFIPARFLFRKPKAIEIPMNRLANFEITSSFFGWKIDLILYQFTDKGVIAYPSISLSALDKKSIDGIQQSLEVIIDRFKSIECSNI